MKKLMSLVLAVLMLASLTVSTGAAKIIGSDSYDKPVTMSDVFNYYKNFHSSSSKPSVNLPGGIQYGDIYTAWYGTCSKCGGFAFFYVSDGNIKWICLEDDCGKSGTIYAPDDDDDDDDDDDYHISICPECGKSSQVYYLDTRYNKNSGKLEDIYYCGRCHETFTRISSHLPDHDDDDDDDDDDCDFDDFDDIDCSNKHCNRDAEFQYFFYKDGYLYARYECSRGHVTNKRIYGYDYDEYLYNIKVITTRGGDYDIVGNDKAAYGETKTIIFEPDYGYVLTDVYVNGNSVKVTDDEIKIEVKGNTVVRAYFTRLSELKNYTVKASATNGGKITASLNSKTVDASKITAKYSDKIVYRFTPASKNYYVADVKVNGKSVGKVSSYTVSRLTSDTKIEVTFKWNCPYDDVSSNSKYYKAIEYVTEAGILTGTKSNTLKPKFNFNGTRGVTIKTFACALAEMADVKGVLSDNTDREEWAEKYELIGRKEDTSVFCDVQRACDMVKVYLEVLEDKNDISFEGVSSKDSAKETAIAIDMVTPSTYKNNRNLNKNDLAAVLYLISNLEYDD